MQLEYPLTNHMKGNIVLTQEKTAIAYYRVRSETVMLTDVEKKLKTKRKVARALNRLKANDENGNGFRTRNGHGLRIYMGNWCTFNQKRSRC